jgi:cobalamin biosynthesis protein CbiG
VPIANLNGFISPVIRLILNFKNRHPGRPERLEVDYEIISLTMPIIYLGTLVGVRIGPELSDIEVAISLGLVLLYMSYTSIKKFFSIRKKENSVLLIES